MHWRLLRLPCRRGGLGANNEVRHQSSEINQFVELTEVNNMRSLKQGAHKGQQRPIAGASSWWIMRGASSAPADLLQHLLSALLARASAAQ